jgi:anti-sigma28 factor (negative regulator of flagellin synthesis)
MPDIGNVGSSIGSTYSAGFSNPAISTVRTSTDVGVRRVVDIAAPSRAGSGDRVEVSEVARWLEEMNRLPAIREDKVAAARAAIANGSLDSDDNLSIALGRMLDEIG